MTDISPTNNSHKAVRRRLENRRACEYFSFTVGGLRFTASVSRFADGRIAELATLHSRLKSGWPIELALTAKSRSIHPHHRMMTVFGQTLPIFAWAKKFGVRQDTLRWRLSRGWLPEKALTTKVATPIRERAA